MGITPHLKFYSTPLDRSKDIVDGPAVVCHGHNVATGKAGWFVPGGEFTESPLRARTVCREIRRLMEHR